ncbi:hypothetical protein Glove_346g77 [Diversispora epigaea]|uniref:Uncharacterized protein n=1 Tax=Diversispora epigaea TaxID=1348612 RepID=A0A397HFB2_9GLOM|nr:hypothetical protein Glove_346g77 [Diversispora epigaea]
MFLSRLTRFHIKPPNYDEKNEKNHPSPPPVQHLEKPPVSDTIVPTPMATAFHNMFDDSFTSSWTMENDDEETSFHIKPPNYDEKNEKNHPSPPPVQHLEKPPVSDTIVPTPMANGVGFGYGKDKLGGVFDGWKEDFLKIYETITPKPGRNVSTVLLPIRPTSARTGKPLI